MDWNSLTDVLSRSEDDEVEFKTGIPPIEVLAQQLAAFGNSPRGGHLYLGIKETPEGNVVSGVNPRRAVSALGSAVLRLDPQPHIYAKHLESPQGSVFHIQVDPVTEAPVTGPDGVYVRKGADTHLATAGEILTHIHQTAVSAAPDGDREWLAQALERQAEETKGLKAELVKANSWRRRAPLAVLTGAGGFAARELWSLIEPLFGGLL